MIARFLLLADKIGTISSRVFKRGVIIIMKEKMIASIIEIVVGAALIIASLLGVVDEFWSGMGTSLLIIGILFLIRAIKYKTNGEYREKWDIENNDERNKYISLKAWAWAGYLFVLIAAAGTIILKIIGREDLMMMASGSVCIIMVLYWISYTILKRKY